MNEEATTLTKDQTIALQQAEIERLRSDLAATSNSLAVAAQALNEEEREIERLRGLLREAPKHPMTESLRRRVREALGE